MAKPPNSSERLDALLRGFSTRALRSLSNEQIQKNLLSLLTKQRSSDVFYKSSSAMPLKVDGSDFITAVQSDRGYLDSKFEEPDITVKQKLLSHSAGVCRIDDENGVHIGSGFLVKPNLIATAHHVVFNIADANAVGGFTPRGQPMAVFAPDPSSGQPAISARIEECFTDSNIISLFEDSIDVAFLRVQPLALPVLPIDLGWTLPAQPYAVGCLGYHGDPGHVPGDRGSYISGVFNIGGVNHFGVKVFTRGEGTPRNTLPIMCEHLVPTLPGSSGAPVVDLKTMQVIGVHCMGFYAISRNFFQPLGEVLRNSVPLQTAFNNH
jgi:hypothetical protein